MAQQNKFDIVISAVDKASKPIANINRHMEKMLRPMKQLERSSKNLAKNLHLDKAARGINGTFGGASRALQGLGVGSPLVSGLAGGVGVAALTAMLARLTTNFGAYGTTVSRLQGRTGVGFKASQRLRGAAKMAGLPPEVMDSGLTSLADTMRNAQFDPQLAMLFSKLGIKPSMKADGTPDVAAMLPKLADAVAAQKNPATSAAILNQMGLGQLFPLLSGGASGLEDFSKKAEKAGLVLDDISITKAEHFGRSLDTLSANLTGIGNSLAKTGLPAAQSGVDYINNRLNSDSPNVGFMERIIPLRMLANAFEFGEALGAPSDTTASGSRSFSGRVVNESGGSGGAFKNNNPGNLRVPGRSSGFQSFLSSQQGLQAMAGQLGLYYNRDHINTISGVVSKYAPPNENDTQAYINNVSKRTGFGANQALNLNDPAQLQSVMQAMLVQEQGKSAQAINPQELAQAIAAALKGVTLNAKVQGGAGNRVAYAMPSDGVR